MGTKATLAPAHPAFGKISPSLIAAKKTLRDRLLVREERDLVRAQTLRRTKRFHPSPDVNLVGIGIGEKLAGGAPTGELCVKLFVAKKYPRAKLGRGDALPAAIDGILTDVEDVGYPRRFVPRALRRHRPVVGGVSVGLDQHAVPYRFAGTLGVLVEDAEIPGALYLLSNNHVLADENRAAPGAGVVQPGTLDGGKDADRIGVLDRFAPLRFQNRQNWMDAALAAMEPQVQGDRRILGIGPPTGAGAPGLNMVVRKSGRTTGVTEGIVRALDTDILDIEYDQGMVRMDDVIVIKGTDRVFSRAGDSGSAIVDASGKVVALLFAGSDVVTFAMPIRRILRRLGVRIAT